MVITHNITAMNTNRQLGAVYNRKQKATEKLSSGYRINRSADDAAGLAISEKMRAQIHGLERSSDNASDGISVVQTAEGALNEVHSILQRMIELATQAANDTNTSVDRDAIATEIDELVSEVNRISSSTQFNTMNLLDGSFTGKNLQVGALSGQNIELDIESMSASSLKLVIPGGEPASVTSSNPSLSPSVTNEAKVTDTTLTYDSYYPVTPASIRVPDGNTYLTPAGESYFVGSALSRYVIYAEAGTQYGNPAQTISTSGYYEFKAANGDEIRNVSNLNRAATVSVNYHPTYINYNSAPTNLSHLEINDGSVSSTPVTGWTNGSTGVSLSDYGVSVSGTPAVGDTLSLHATSDGTLKVDSFVHAGQSMSRIQNALDKVSTQRSKLGAIQNRLEYTIANLNGTAENTTAAESRIRDTDMAKEMVEFSKENILSQAGQAMLTLANQSMEGVLSLLA